MYIYTDTYVYIRADITCILLLQFACAHSDKTFTWLLPRKCPVFKYSIRLYEFYVELYNLDSCSLNPTTFANTKIVCSRLKTYQ